MSSSLLHGRVRETRRHVFDLPETDLVRDTIRIADPARRDAPHHELYAAQQGLALWRLDHVRIAVDGQSSSVRVGPPDRQAHAVLVEGLVGWRAANSGTCGK